MRKLYLKLYLALTYLYPSQFRRRFGDGLRQTFLDLSRDRGESASGLFFFSFGTYFETLAAVAREWIPIMQNNPILRIALGTLLLLSIPLVAMQFTDEVAWGSEDFVVGGALLFGAGLAYELLSRKAGQFAHKAAFGIAVGASLVLVWMNLAVGLIGSENNPANLLYLGVLATGIIGSFVARLRPSGMARALFAMAVVQALVPVLALVIWRPDVGGSGLAGLVLVNSFFVILFASSGLLFLRAREEAVA